MRSISCLAPVLLPLLCDVLSHLSEFEDISRDVDAVEFMCGKAEISNAAARRGLVSIGYDKSYSASDINDINSLAGFKRAMQLAMRVRPHGSIWCAPVCSSWTWISRSSTGRSVSCAQGDTDRTRTRQSNFMVVRLALILLVAWLRGVHLFMENPVSSVIQHFSPMREVVQCLLTHRVVCHLCSFGADTQKSVAIWSTTPLVSKLYRPKVPTSKRLCTRDGDSVTGKAKELKQSQAYPRDFGVAVAAIYCELFQKADVNDMLDSEVATIVSQALVSGGRGKRKRV